MGQGEPDGTSRATSTRTGGTAVDGAGRGPGRFDVDGVTVRFGGLTALDSVSLFVEPGEVLGVIGPNGAGKTTLFRMITGQERPDDGTLRLGETVQVGYVDQSRDSLDPNKSVWEEITGGRDEIEMGKRTVNGRAYCSWFNFKGAGQQRKVGSLSGGERNRLHLAKLLKTGCNLLLLDEPSMGLAPIVVEQIFETIVDINRRVTTILLVEQNAAMALGIATRGYVLETGAIALTGTAAELAGNADVRRAYLGE